MAHYGRFPMIMLRAVLRKVIGVYLILIALIAFTCKHYAYWSGERRGANTRRFSTDMLHSICFFPFVVVRGHLLRPAKPIGSHTTRLCFWYWILCVILYVDHFNDETIFVILQVSVLDVCLPPPPARRPSPKSRTANWNFYYRKSPCWKLSYFCCGLWLFNNANDHQSQASIAEIMTNWSDTRNTQTCVHLDFSLCTVERA